MYNQFSQKPNNTIFFNNFSDIPKNNNFSKKSSLPPTFPNSNPYSSDSSNDFDSIFNNIKNSTSNSSKNNSSNSFPNIDMETIFKVKSIMDKMNNPKDNPRSNLLLSLKPYLKKDKKEKIDQYINLFNMTELFQNFNNGGEK